jgi:8-oxo-dGTP diphosphatase
MILNSISVDCVIFGFDKSGLRVLLNQTDKEALRRTLPAQASSDQIKQLYEKHPVFTSDLVWSLFGGHVPEAQDLDEFAKNLLFQATGLNDVYLQQIHAFGSLQ